MLRSWSGALALWAWCSLATAQTVIVDTIRELSTWPVHRWYTFPKVSMPGNEAIAHRIQKDLCVDFLMIDPDSANGHYFSEVWSDSSRTGRVMAMLSDIEWSYTRPLPGVLVIDLSAEGCGAYCEPFRTHYNYALATGDRLEFDHLFTEEGLTLLNNALSAEWHRLAMEQLVVLVDSLDVPGSDTIRGWSMKVMDMLIARADSLSAVRPNTPDQQWFREAVELLKNCIAERPSNDPYIADMELRGEGIHLWLARCSAHADRNVDELWEVEMDFPYEDLAPQLKPAYQQLLVK